MLRNFQSKPKMCHTLFKDCLRKPMTCSDGDGESFECERKYQANECQEEFKECLKKSK